MVEWLIALAGAGLLVKIIFGSIEASQQQEMLDIEKERQEAERQNDFNNALKTLDELKSNFDMLQNVTIPELDRSISDQQRDIDLWDQRYDLATGEIQAEIDTVDDLIGNWQNSYDAQTLRAQSEGQETLNTLLSNWSNAEVMAADRGMGGSMGLVAQQQKQRAIAYAGSDLSLAGDDGIYGAAYATLVSNLNSQMQQYETKRGLLSADLDLTKESLEGELSSWTEQLRIDTNARNKLDLSDSYELMVRQFNENIVPKYNVLGTKNPDALKRAEELLEEYGKYV